MRELETNEYEQLGAALVSVEDRFAELLASDAEPDRSLARLYVAGAMQVAVANDIEAIIREVAMPIRVREQRPWGGRP